MSSSPSNNAQSSLAKPPNGSTRHTPQGPASVGPEGSPVDPTATTATSVIGNDLTILGENITIISQNKLQVDGHVHGDVHGKEVVISENGSVTGKVRAEKVDVHGDVRGSMQALTVALHESAKVRGDIMHQTLTISEGAEFDGRVQRTKDKNDLIPVLDAEAFASQSGKDTDQESHLGSKHKAKVLLSLVGGKPLHGNT